MKLTVDVHLCVISPWKERFEVPCGVFGRDAGIVLDVVFPGKAKEVTWGIPCVGVEEVGG